MNTSNKESEMKQGDKVRIIASKEELADYGIDVGSLERQFYIIDEVSGENAVWLCWVGCAFKMSMLEVQ